MKDPSGVTYRRIEKAIDYIHQHFRDQPSLDQVAEQAHLSSFHFQRLFSAWAGVSPKKFVQYLSLEYAKDLLKTDRATLLDTALDTGLSGPSRLHDLFVQIEGMTPGVFKSGGAGLTINFSFAESPFGTLLVASTPRGVCHMAFVDDEDEALQRLKHRFPNAAYRGRRDRHQQKALSIFQEDWSDLDAIRLHLAGTPFQLKVWETLLRIPMGRLTTYGAVAEAIGRPAAARAVGRAIGSNPIAYVIPCHRVIQRSGHPGGYAWGSNRKSAMIGWEAARTEAQDVLSESR